MDAEPDEMAVFIGLNPSTADETVDDPTIRRCINFARSWGRSGVVMLNIFALRSTDPKVLFAVSDPVGLDNDHALTVVSAVCQPVVACWGVHGSHLARGYYVKQLLRQTCPAVFHLGLTKSGQPKHPLYLRKTTERIRW